MTETCTGIDVACGDGTCDLDCGSSYQNCGGGTVSCGTNRCSAACTGDAADAPPEVVPGDACDVIDC